MTQHPRPVVHGNFVRITQRHRELLDLWAERDAQLEGLMESVPVDPAKPRRLKLPVLLEVRCRAQGHDLAVVYRTALGPALVKTATTSGGLEPQSMRRRALGTSPQTRRDAWFRIMQLVDDPFADYCEVACRCGEKSLPMTLVRESLEQKSPRAFLD